MFVTNDSGERDARRRSRATSTAAEDAELIEAARALSEDAWAAIYARHAEQVYAYIFYRIGDRHASEDLTADVFVRAISGIKKYQWRGTPLVAWLYRIAHNVTIDYRKQQARRSARESTVDAVNVEDDVDQIRAFDGRDDMSRAIRMLTDEQQQVIILRFYGGLPTAQVAAVTNRPITAVKALQARALRSLRRILSEGDRRQA